MPCGVLCTNYRRQTVDHDITAFVGLDVHQESIAIAVAAPGRAAPRFVGTTGPQLSELLGALAHLGRPKQLLMAYEAGPCGYPLVRALTSRASPATGSRPTGAMHSRSPATCAPVS
jgi:hypothetical protein